MILSAESKKELLDFSKTSDFNKVEKVVFADNLGSEEATKQFTDFIQSFHKLADHPTRKTTRITGIFLL